MSQMTKGELYFSVDGAFIMDLARDAYWFEGRKEWALDTLACFDGITTEQTMKVLRGEARLDGVASQTSHVRYTERIDSKFTKRLKEYQNWLREAELKKAEQLERESIERLNEIASENPRIELSPDDESLLTSRTKALRQAATLHDEVMSGRPEKLKQITSPKEPVRLGKFVVEKKLLDDYLQVATEHELLDPWTPGTALLLSGRMMKIHLILRESVGLTGYWGRDPKRPGEPDKFDRALQAVVHSHVKKDARYKLKEEECRSRYDLRDKQIRANTSQVGAETEQEGADSYNPEVKEPLVKGIPASKGTATGPVRLALTEDALKNVKEGEVLVAAMITPDTIFAIDKVAALVTDVGGLTSHAAIVSREFGIPCIVGAGNATKVLKDGDIVTVDGSTGLIFPAKTV